MLIYFPYAEKKNQEIIPSHNSWQFYNNNNRSSGQVLDLQGTDNVKSDDNGNPINKWCSLKSRNVSIGHGCPHLFNLCHKIIKNFRTDRQGQI